MDSALKQRLLGAAVLIALAIIFVPIFFSNSPPKQDNTTLGLSIPPAPERNFETRTLSVDAPAKSASTPVPKTPAVPVSSVADGDKVATVSTGAPSSFEAPESASAPAATSHAPAATPVNSKPAAAPTAKPEPPPAPSTQSDGRFVVNLGIYADAGGAAALVAKVKKLGYPAFAETTEYQGKSAQRVRVGPYADRAAAEGVRLKIKQSEEKVASSVVDLGDRAKDSAAADGGKPVKDSTPPAAPALASNRAGGYAVQVGAFKAEDEANKLRDRLRIGGVAAFVEKGKSGDQTMWKVRAGPYADRVGADTALANIKQKFQINGMITTQP
jgi:DedD protein